jgi:hypothetical protein
MQIQSQVFTQHVMQPWPEYIFSAFQLNASMYSVQWKYFFVGKGGARVKYLLCHKPA